MTCKNKTQYSETKGDAGFLFELQRYETIHKSVLRSKRSDGLLTSIGDDTSGVSSHPRSVISKTSRGFHNFTDSAKPKVTRNNSLGAKLYLLRRTTFEIQ